METLFRWIHLSDIHFGHGDASHGWDQKLVLDQLVADIAARVSAEHARVDAILVTGDIAFSGNGRRATEYADARRWLLAVATAAGVSPEQVFLVPGNHDVNRGADKAKATERLVRDLREGRERLDTALADAGDRGLLAERMAGYLELSAGFAPACLRDAASRESRLYWTHRTTTRGLKLRLIGLNTALLAKDEHDHGKLSLGNEQLARALTDPAVDDGELVIALSHHPLRSGWLADEKEADGWIRSKAHIHLSGHVHEADSEEARSGAGGKFVRVVAGAAHGDLEPGVPASHGYSFGAVARDGDALRMFVWPRRWSPKNKAFRVDVENVGEGAEHAEHELRVKPAAVPPKTAPPPAEPVGLQRAPLPPAVAATKPITPAPASSGPVRVFVASCEEDTELRRTLEKHLKPLERAPLRLIATTSRASAGAGEEWRAAATAALASAEVILLLLSADYLASDYCVDVELAAAEALHRAGKAKVYSVLLRPIDYAKPRSKADDTGDAWFEKLECLPANGQPVTRAASEDEAFAEIARQVRAYATSLRKR